VSRQLAVRLGMVYETNMARVLVLLAVLASLVGIAPSGVPLCGDSETCCVDVSGCDPVQDSGACSDCACCAHFARPLVAAPGAALPPLPSACGSADREASLAFSAVPRDIFHVPKAL